MHFSTPRRRHAVMLALETLEARDVPAGNVTASVVLQGGVPTLQVIGDSADNDVVLRGNRLGVIEVQGVGTTINGETAKLTFMGVGSLFADLGDGNDSIKTQDLVLPDVSIIGGGGDDTIRLLDTRSEQSLYMAIAGDGGGTNGNDTISVTGTVVHGTHAVMFIDGDEYSDTGTGLDRITIADTTIAVENYVDLETGYLGAYGMTGPGDIITVENFDVSVSTASNGWSIISFQGGSGDDQFRLRNINVDLHDEAYVVADMFVGSYEGNDTIDAKDLCLRARTDRTEGNSFEVFNQFWVGFIANTTRLTDVYFEGGGKFYDPDYGFFYTTGSVGITGSEIDVRDVTTYSKGSAGLALANSEWLTGVEQDDHWTVANCHASADDGTSGGLYLDSGGGNDCITVSNSSCEYLGIDLGAGDDALSFRNSEGNVALAYGAGGIYGGDGDDSVEVVHCTFPGLIINLGAGDDSLTLRHNEFGTLLADLGDGNDTADVRHNTATDSFSLDGGAGIDVLIALHNVSPSLLFENFEA